MKKEIYSIPSKLVGHHEPSLKAMIDSWSSMLVSKDEFKSTIYDVGLAYAKKAGVKVWIVDTSQAIGVFKQEVQGFIETKVAPDMTANGVKFFFVILPKTAISSLAVKKVAQINGDQKGMQTIEVASVEQALDLLKTQGSHTE